MGKKLTTWSASIEGERTEKNSIKRKQLTTEDRGRGQEIYHRDRR